METRTVYRTNTNNKNKDPQGYEKGIDWQPKYTRMLVVVIRQALLLLAKILEEIIKENDNR